MWTSAGGAWPGPEHRVAGPWVRHCFTLPETSSSPNGRRQSPDGSHGDGKDLVRRVPNVGHTANLLTVCIYRHTAKKSEQTPSRPADGVDGSSPGACAVDTRQTYRLRRAPERQAHGKPSGFAMCPSGRHTAKDGHFARPAHTVTLPCAMGPKEPYFF